MKRTLFVMAVCCVAGLAAGFFLDFGVFQGRAAPAWAGLAPSVPGDVNGDGSLNLTDAVYLLNFLFLGGPPPIPCPAATAPVSTVIVVRHAERESGGADPALTPEGQARAAHLAQVLRNLTIDALVASNLQRTIQTLQPLANLKAMAIEQIPDADAVVQRLDALPAGSLAVVAHHSFTIHPILNGLGVVGGDAIDVDGDHYDNLIMVLRPDGRQAQLVHLTY